MYYHLRNQRESLENELLGILSNFPEIIDRLNFKIDYFSFDLHKKVFRYLKDIKRMDYLEMLKYMTQTEADMFVNNIYATNIYDSSRESMALGFAKLILEEYKKDEIEKLDDRRRLDMISSDEYYVELTDIKNLTVEPKVEILTDEIIDEYVSDDNEGIKIKRFEYLSSYLKLGVTDVVTVAGVSGFGKSAFLLNVFQSLSQDTDTLFKCQYFNIEIAPKGIVKRLLAITSDRLVDEFKKDNIDMKFYKESKKKIQNDSIINNGSISLEELKAKVLNNIDKDKINVVFIDHIGLLDVNDKNYNKSEYDRVTYCMKELRKLALDNDLILFIASQFDRSSVKDKKISMHSLKSSGEIENSSTHVLLLRESEIKQSTDKKMYEEVLIEIAKNRNGPIAKLDYYTFVKSKQLFNEKMR